MACLASGVRGVEGNEPPLGPQTEAMGRQGLERCLGPPSSTKVALGLPWPSSVPVVTAGLQRPLGLPPPPPPPPASRRPERWQTVGQGASDSLPDLPGSPRLPAGG